MASEAVAAFRSTAVARLTVPIQGDEEFLTPIQGVAVSPTVHTWCTSPGGVESSNCHLRAIDGLENKVMGGTEGASAPFFSTDSQWVGFFAEGKLKKDFGEGRRISNRM